MCFCANELAGRGRHVGCGGSRGKGGKGTQLRTAALISRIHVIFGKQDLFDLTWSKKKLKQKIKPTREAPHPKGQSKRKRWGNKEL